MSFGAVAALIGCQRQIGTPTPTPGETSVSQDGVTFHFSEPRTVGQYVDGSWWVQGPVTITSITPDSGIANENDWRFSDVDGEMTCVFDATNNRINQNAPARAFANGTKIRFTIINNTTGLTINTDYFVVGKTSTYFQVAATLGGPAIDFTTNGTGTYYIKGVDGRIINGAQLNPGNADDVGGVALNATGPQKTGVGGALFATCGYDNLSEISYASVIARNYGTEALYTDSLNVDPSHTGNPLTVEEGTVVKAISWLDGVFYIYDSVTPLYLVPLTVVREGYTPPVNALRPAISETDKTSYWTLDMLDMSSLPDLELPVGATMPDPVASAEQLRRMHNMQNTNSISIRSIAALNNQTKYGRDIAYYLSDAAALLLLEDVTDQQKTNILIGFFQQGIDAVGRIEQGGIFEALGGGNCWHKFSVACLAQFMPTSTKTDIVLATLPDEAQMFQETIQIKTIDWLEVNMAPAYDATNGGRLNRGYEEFERGEFDWNLADPEIASVYSNGDNWNKTYRTTCTTCTIGYELAVALVPGMADIWQDAGDLEYFDRAWLMEQGDRQASFVAAGEPIRPFIRKMLESYWPATNPGTTPTPVSASVRGDRLWVKFSGLMDWYSRPDVGDLAISVNGSPAAIQEEGVPEYLDWDDSYYAPKGSPYIFGHSLAVTLETPLTGGETVLVSYTPGGSPLRSLEGVNAAAITNMAVTNLTGVMVHTATSTPRVTNNGNAYAAISSPYPQVVADKFALVMSFTIDVVGTVQPFFGLVGSTASPRAFIGGGFLRFNGPGFNFVSNQALLSIGNHTLAFEVDKSQASIAAGGVRVWVDGVEIFDNGSSTYTAGGTFTLDSMTGAVAGGGGNPISFMYTVVGPTNGKEEFIWLHLREPSDPAFNVGAVLSSFTTAGEAIGGNGEGPYGVPPLYYFGGPASERNSEQGLENSGTWFGMHLKKLAGTYS